jgi:ribosomal protein S18 acetylase RimI-like enzyme
MQDEIRIEPYRPDDRARVQAFVEGIQEHERQFYPELRPGSEMADYGLWMLRQVEERNGAILMARAGEHTIGCVCAWIEPGDERLVEAAERSHAYVSDLFVDRAFRRRGVAQTLLRRIEEEMRRRGARRIQIHARGQNAQAIRCYEEFGYTSYVVIFDKPIS